MDNLKERAESKFKKQQQAREGEKAWLEYQAEAVAVRERTAKLRALRLAQEAEGGTIPSASVATPAAPARAVKTGKRKPAARARKR